MLESKFKQQIAEELTMSLSTLKRKLKQHDLKIPRGLICPTQQKLIYETLGYQELWKARYAMTANEPKRLLMI